VVTCVKARLVTSANVELSAESWILTVTSVPVNAPRWRYACAPKLADAAVSMDVPFVAAVSVRIPAVRRSPHSRP
jgi:hypothetical protein